MVELRSASEIFVAYCTCSLGLPLSRIDTFLSTAVTKWSSSFKKTLLTQSVILITRYIFGTILFWERCQLIFDKICPKNATFKLSLMSNDEQKIFIHFYILHIKNVWFLLELEMVLVTTIGMIFAQVCSLTRNFRRFLSSYFSPNTYYETECPPLTSISLPVCITWFHNMNFAQHT